jgi:phospholipase B1
MANAMKTLCFALNVLLLVACYHASGNEEEEIISVEFKDKFKEAFKKAEKELKISDTTNITTWDMEGKGTPFDCKLFPPTVTKPSTVHELTPYDIDVVGALGDSITAGFGAKACTLLTDIIPFRGVSWSIGGDKDLSKVTTLPNILRKYNPNLKGYSVKSGSVFSRKAKFNVAFGGAIAQNMPWEAKRLVSKMKSDCVSLYLL